MTVFRDWTNEKSIVQKYYKIADGMYIIFWKIFYKDFGKIQESERIQLYWMNQTWESQVYQWVLDFYWIPWIVSKL